MPTDSLTAVDPVGWLLSFGRRPLQRSLEPVRDVIELKQLRKQHAEPERQVELEHRIRRDFFPIIKTIFDAAGLHPATRVETVARDAVIHELLDKLCTSGFLRMADLRDAVAKHPLKLSDTSLRDFVRGDALLQIDKQLAEKLYGVYYRGELYLRGIQRFSGIAFGTAVGRWLTLFAALPFGGAFLAVEFVQHMSHAAMGLFGVPTTPHEGLSDKSVAAILILGLLNLLLLHVPAARRLAVKFLRCAGSGLRWVFFTVPMWVMQSPPVQWLLKNPVTHWCGRHLAMPLLTTLPVFIAQVHTGVDLPTRATSSITMFAASLLFFQSALGRRIQDEIVESCRYAWRFLSVEVFQGIIAWIMRFFRRALGIIEKVLHAVDEALRLRPGEPVWKKTLLALLWFPVAYVIRFGFYLLLEPQVNPIKHFPVVTVSHKVMFGLIGTVSKTFDISLEAAGFVLTLVPGIFGFLVWEFKENWKLYAANRADILTPLPIGSHGETVRRLLRPGFHSGTLPKLFEKIRREELKVQPNPKRLAKLNHELEHVAHEVADFVERQGVALLPPGSVTVTAINLFTDRIELSLQTSEGESLLKWEHRDGVIVASCTPEPRDPATQHMLRGLFAMGSVESVVSWPEWVAYWQAREAITSPAGSATRL